MGRYSFQPGPEHQLLSGDPFAVGELQIDWLIRELQASSADWKFICTCVTFNPAVRSLLQLALHYQGSDVEALVAQFGFGSMVDELPGRLRFLG